MTFGIICGFTSVILVMLMGQSRVFYSMSRDGLVPKVFSDIHPKFQTPWRSNVLFFFFVAPFSALPAAQRGGPHDQHRHAVRLRHRLRRRLGDARQTSRPAAALPDAVGARWCRFSEWSSTSR